MKTELQQIYELTIVGLKIRYRKTYVGLIWVVLNPVVLLFTQGFVFSQIFHLQMGKYFLYLVSGLFPWVFISQTLEMGTAHIRAQAMTIKSFFIKPYQVTAALTLENIVNLLAAQLLILTPIIFYNNRPFLTSVLWLVNEIPLAVSVFALAYIFGVLNILFRDLKYILSFLLSIFYFITPIFYKPDLIPDPYRSFIFLNPFHILLLPFQSVSEDLNFSNWIESLFWASSLSVALIFLALFVWRKVKNYFYINL